MSEKPTELKIRHALVIDLAGINKLFSKIVRDLGYYNSLAKHDEIRKYRVGELTSKIRIDPFSVIVAKDRTGKVIGFCFSRFDDYTIWIDWICVAPDWRKRKVGQSILRTLFESAPKRKARKVWCDCRTSNVPSKKFLKSAGFEKIVEIKNHWYNQDFILWQKSLLKSN